MLTIWSRFSCRYRQRSSISVESLNRYKSIIRDTTADLEDHLKNVNDKLQSEFYRVADLSSEDAALVRKMEEERSSAQQCLAICAELSAHISQIQPTLTANRDGRPADAAIAGVAMAEKITADGLNGCKDALSLASQQLEEHLKSIVERLMATSKKALSSPEDMANLEQLHAEWQTARLCMDVCSKANEGVTKVNVNIFENMKGEEEVAQIFASTIGKTVHAKDVYVGSKGVQFGGQASNATLQQISRDFSPRARMGLSDEGPEIAAAAAAVVDETVVDEGETLRFLGRYGKGRKLSPQLDERDLVYSPTPQGAERDNLA